MLNKSSIASSKRSSLTPSVETAFARCEELRKSDLDEGLAIAKKVALKAKRNGELFAFARASEYVAIFSKKLSNAALALRSIDQAIEGYRALRKLEYLAIALVRKGEYLRESHTLSEAEIVFEEACQILNKTHSREAWAYYLLWHGNFLSYTGKLVEGLRELLEALRIAEEEELIEINASVLHALAIYYFSRRDPKRALSYVLQSVSEFEKDKNYVILPSPLMTAAIIFAQLENEEKAREYFERALKAAKAVSLVNSLVFILGNFVQFLYTFDEKSLAKKYLTELFAVLEYCESKPPLIFAYESIGWYYLQTKDLQKAIMYLNMALENVTPNTPKELDILETLLEVYNASKDTAQSIKIIQRCLEVKEKLFSIEKEREIAHIEMQAELYSAEQEKKKARNREEKLLKELQEKEQLLSKYSLHISKKKEFLYNLRNSFVQKGSEQQKVVQQIDHHLADEDSRVEKEFELNMAHKEFMSRAAKKYPDLSPTELKVASLLRINLSSKSIASLLSTSSRTVDYHRLNIRRKMRLKREASLSVALAKI